MIDVQDELVGTQRDRSVLAIAYLGIGCLLVVGQWAVTRFVLKNDRFVELGLLYDVLAWSAIAFVGTSYLVAICYAGWNGGPGLVVAIPLVPTLLGSALRGQFGVSVDFALAVGAATCATWIACWRTYRSGATHTKPAWGIGIAVATSVVAVGTVRSVFFAAGPYASTGASVATALVTIGIGIVVVWILDVAWRQDA